MWTLSFGFHQGDLLNLTLCSANPRSYAVVKAENMIGITIQIPKKLHAGLPKKKATVQWNFRDSD